MSGNDPQYAAETFRQFADKYGFIHVTSSPTYSQSNGEAERAVQTEKLIAEKRGPIFGYPSLPQCTAGKWI